MKNAGKQQRPCSCWKSCLVTLPAWGLEAGWWCCCYRQALGCVCGGGHMVTNSKPQVPWNIKSKNKRSNKWCLTRQARPPRCGTCQHTGTCSCQQAAPPFLAWAWGVLGLAGALRPGRALRTGFPKTFRVHPAHWRDLQSCVHVKNPRQASAERGALMDAGRSTDFINNMHLLNLILRAVKALRIKPLQTAERKGNKCDGSVWKSLSVT